MLSPQHNLVSAERDIKGDCMVPLSVGRKSNISDVLKDQRIPKHLLGIKIDRFNFVIIIL